MITKKFNTIEEEAEAIRKGKEYLKTSGDKENENTI